MLKQLSAVSWLVERERDGGRGRENGGREKGEVGVGIERERGLRCFQIEVKCAIILDVRLTTLYQLFLFGFEVN